MPPFRFKQFSIEHDRCAHKVGTDGVLLGAWVEAENPKTILDVGTGSGLIALMLAHRFPNAQIIGIELDEPSAVQATQNAANSPFKERIEIMQGDFLEYDFQSKFDIIVSNPPFFKGNTSSGKAERDRARHEEYLPQGRFLERVVSLLSSKGKLTIILPKEEARLFMSKANTLSLYPSRITKVFGRAGADDKRWLICLNRSEKKKNETALTLRDEGGKWSRDYQKLTQDFHPKYYA